VRQGDVKIVGEHAWTDRLQNDNCGLFVMGSHCNPPPFVLEQPQRNTLSREWVRVVVDNCIMQLRYAISSQFHLSRATAYASFATTLCIEMITMTICYQIKGVSCCIAHTISTITLAYKAATLSHTNQWHDDDNYTDIASNTDIAFNTDSHNRTYLCRASWTCLFPFFLSFGRPSM
jgi:hypothetical protein